MITKIVIEWSEEDNCYGGHAYGDDGKTFISFEGNTVAEAMEDCINEMSVVAEIRKKLGIEVEEC